MIRLDIAVALGDYTYEKNTFSHGYYYYIRRSKDGQKIVAFSNEKRWVTIGDFRMTILPKPEKCFKKLGQAHCKNYDEADELVMQSIAMKTKAVDITDRSLTVQQYKEVMNRIWQKHRFGISGRSIKYVRPDWDMRDGKCFHLEFNDGSVAFDFRDNDNSMYDNIMNWLKEKE